MLKRDRHSFLAMVKRIQDILSYCANLFKTNLTLCTIWGFHGGDYEEWCLLGSYKSHTA
jgi:hypothetical protein